MLIAFSRLWRILTAFALVLSMLAGSLILASSQAVAQPGKVINLQIIVDQSGSMAAETDTGVLRIDAAKAVLNEVIAQIPEAEGVNVGFRVYGHLGNNQPEGKPQSCVSSDLLVPMQGVDKAALTAQVDALVPVGWTPLGYSLEQASADFTQPASEDVVNAIIMVTDGLETCDADPAAIAGKLKNSEAGITTHVIGFGTNPEELAILEGITQASGGQLLGSNNAGQLMDALFEILEELDVVEETGTGEARNSPLGVGRIGQVGDYEVSVLSVTPDATEQLMAANTFIEGPAPGNQFFQVRLAITYVGSSSGTPGADLDPKAVGDASVSYTIYNNHCGFGDFQGSFVSSTELFTGGSAEYNLCWQISSADQDSLVMYIESWTHYNADPVWFSLGNPIEVTVNPEGTAAAEPTAAPTAEPIAPTEPADTGVNQQDNSRGSPVPVGETSQVGDFEITVVSVTPDAFADIQAHDSFAEPPSPGTQYYMVRVQVTYVGSSSGNPSYELEFQSVGDQSKSYSSLTNMCSYGNIPDAQFMATELFAGGSGEYNVCWAIDSVDQGSLVMYVESLLHFNVDPVWFSLQP